jgi:thiamine monophosphate synthase
MREMSVPAEQRHADRVSGFLCAFSFALSGIAMTRNPGLLATAAILVALVAVVMTNAHQKLAAAAVAVAGAAFFIGMVVAVLTDSGIY